MKKIKWEIIVIIIIVMLYSSMCWLSFIKNGFGSNVSQSNSKTNSLVNNIDNKINDFDSKWYNSMFIMKYLSKVDSIVEYFTFNQVKSNDVIEGKNKWLFYNGGNEVNSLQDYEGINKYSEKEKNKTLTEVLKFQEQLKNKGILFSLFIPPNKENVYYEFMSDDYSHKMISRTDELIDYLGNGGVNVVNPKKALIANKDKYQLYYKYDTHWNQLGAYIGTDELMKSFNIQIPSIDTTKISNKKLDYHFSATDDLAKMVGLRFIFNDEVEYEIEENKKTDWDKFEKEYNNKEVSRYINLEAPKKGKLLVIGDSYRTAMIPVLRQTFSDLYIVHINHASNKIINEISPDYVVLEYVERYSNRLYLINKNLKKNK